MEFKGRIMKVFPVVSGTGKSGQEWKRQEFVFEYFEHETDRWTDKVVLSVMNDRIEEYDLHEGDEVTIGFGHSVREWNNKYFNEMRVYKLEKKATIKKGVSDNPSPTLPEKGEEGGKDDAGDGEDGDGAAKDDLPF